MRTYCLARRNHTNNVSSWNTTMINNVIRNKSKCGVCLFVCLINQDLGNPL